MNNIANRLLLYKGGGDSKIGCIWQFNFCIWDAKGEWHNIFATGSMGLKTLEETMVYLCCERPDCHHDQSKTLYGGIMGDFEMFDITSKPDMDYFRDNYNPAIIFGISEFMQERDIENVLQVKCEQCGKEGVYYCDEWTSGNPVDEGGIAITNHSVLCRECDDLYRCGYCSEKFDKDTVFDDEGYCPDCHETEIRNKQQILECKLKDSDWEQVYYWNDILRSMMGLNRHQSPDCEGQMYFKFIKCR